MLTSSSRAPLPSGSHANTRLPSSSHANTRVPGSPQAPVLTPGPRLSSGPHANTRPRLPSSSHAYFRLPGSPQTAMLTVGSQAPLKLPGSLQVSRRSCGFQAPWAFQAFLYRRPKRPPKLLKFPGSPGSISKPCFLQRFPQPGHLLHLRGALRNAALGKSMALLAAS